MCNRFILQENELSRLNYYLKHFLNYNSHHTNHIKYNIPFNLATCILIFMSDQQKEALRLKELKKWLSNCGHPESVIDKSIFNAKLQGPAYKPANSENILPLVSAKSKGKSK